MRKMVFRNDPSDLPDFSDSILPVQLYRVNPKDTFDRNKSACVALSLREELRNIGVKIDSVAFDFLSIASAVTAAETLHKREDSPDSWARELWLDIQLINPEMWSAVSGDLSKVLNYLTGDNWRFEFTSGGVTPPEPKKSFKATEHKKQFSGLNSVCLFSGGLDSAVGAIDLINGKTKFKPLLVSHAYKGDKAKQDTVESVLSGDYGRLALSINPRQIKALQGKTDISMRGRSFNFIAMAVVGLSVIRSVNNSNTNEIIIPENGYISINPPLTRRRIGSLSTRTTHPYYLLLLESVLNKVGLNVKLINPYQFKTKGEMLKDCKDQLALIKAVPFTVSCSKWHRKRIQCGVCVPCIIRRASVNKAGFKHDAVYDHKPCNIHQRHTVRDDVFALGTALHQISKKSEFMRWVRMSGPLPQDTNQRHEIESVVRRGLKEVEAYLKSVNAL